MFVQNHFTQGMRYNLIICHFGDTILSGIFNAQFNGKLEFTNVKRVSDNTDLLPGETNSILHIRKDDILSYGEVE